MRRGSLSYWGIVCIALVAAAMAPAAQAAGPAAYQVDPAHSGAVSGATFAPPLGKRWIRRDLQSPVGGNPHFPVMAEGRIYVANGASIYALSRDGRTLWSRALAADGVAYDDGRVFAVDRDGVLQGLSAATGRVLWTTQLPGGGTFAPPTAYGDFVYVTSHYYAFGVRQAEGLQVWSSGGSTSGGLPPAVHENRVYTFEGCAATALERTTGVELWNQERECHGSGSGAPVVRGNRVYAGGAVLDSLTGMVRDTFVATATPAFSGGVGYFLNGNELYARDEASGVVRWRYRSAGPEGFRGSPLVAGSYVYAIVGDGSVIALSRSTGRRVWRSKLGVDYASGFAVPGIAAAGDTLVVSYGGRVVAYRRGRDTPGVNNPDKPPRVPLTLSAYSRRTTYGRAVTLDGELDDDTYDGEVRVEIQADPWPWGRYRRLRRVRVEYDRFSLRVRPSRNTRYRAVYGATYPVSRSKRVQVTSDLNHRLRLVARGKRRVLVRLRVAGPPSARLRGSRFFVYHLRSRRATGRRVGSLKMRGSRTRVAARKTVRTPKLRRSDFFLVCRRERRDDGIGQWAPYMARCGNKRLR